ncbi:MAG TPA: hypothetical protein ENF80_03695 [Thermofilum sp.]|nr:hypothetical protein [Thermofilum sp.]
MNIRRFIYLFFVILGILSIVFMTQWFSYELFSASFYLLMITVLVLTVESLLPRTNVTIKDVLKVLTAIAMVLVVFITVSIWLISIITA